MRGTEQMTLITPEEGNTETDLLIRTGTGQLHALIRKVETIVQQIDQGELEALPNLSKTGTELRHWLRLTAEAEAKRVAERRKQQGLEGGYALDLGQARADIGCRLAKLRAARCCRRIPE